MRVQPVYSRRLFLLDLDGTLIDSRADLALSVNLALGRMSIRPIGMERVTRFVGDGVRALIQRALEESSGMAPPPDDLDRGVALFVEEYSRHLLDSTTLYPGVLEAINSMDWARWAVVTNKPEALCLGIIEGLGLRETFEAVIGGDSVPPFRKPDPEPLLEAMRRCGVPPAEAAMVGDSPVDIEAGRAASVMTVAVTGGYRERRELETSHPDLLLDTIAALPRHFHRPPGD